MDRASAENLDEDRASPTRRVGCCTPEVAVLTEG
jgi:hypothetical protein